MPQAAQQGPDDCLVGDESLDTPATAFLAAQLLPPEFPTALGVFRNVERPAYEDQVNAQVRQEIERAGSGRLEDLLPAGDTWGGAGWRDGELNRPWALTLAG